MKALLSRTSYFCTELLRLLEASDSKASSAHQGGFINGRPDTMLAIDVELTRLRRFLLIMLIKFQSSKRNHKLRKKHMIEPTQIYNMDQTMCRFDMPQNRTNARRGGSTIRIKTTRPKKKGFTVALAASASGKKLPAVIIFKERGGRLGARVLKKLVIPSNVQVSTVFHFMQYW